MSYINEALRKAQRERDAADYKARGILSERGKKSDFTVMRWLFISLTVVILLALALYSWLDFKGKTPQPVSKMRGFPATSGIESMKSANDFYGKARFFHKNGNLSDAKLYYQKALILDPEYVSALNNLGVIYIQEGNYLAGEKSLEEAIRLKPSYADSYYNLACLYALMGKEILGLEYLKKAASLHGSVIEWAKKDKDLEKVRKLSGFKEIIKDGQLVTPVGIFEK
jgi:tetratricopeptide (TPR) repeat protein